MSNTAKIVLGVAIVLLIGWGIVAGQKPQEATGEPIKIGISTILTGDFAAAGVNMVNTVKLAAKEVNESGGINGRPIEVLVEDAGCDSKNGLSAIQKLVNVEGVKYIIGGMCSNGTLAAASVANANKAIIMTPVTGGKNVDEAGEYIFRIANSDVLAGRDLADAVLKLGYKNVGVVAEVTEYTLDIKNTFEQIVKEKGGTVVISEEFQPNTTDYRTLVGKVRAAKPDAVLILSQLGTNAGYFMKQSRELGYSVPLFTDFTFVTNQNAKNIAGSFEGVYFADPEYDAENGKTKSFFAAYQEAYGIPSLIPFHAASSYDGMMMFRDAIETVGDDSEKVKDWLLANAKNRKGLMGTFSLDAKGNSDLGFVIKQVKNGEFIPVQ